MLNRGKYHGNHEDRCLSFWTAVVNDLGTLSEYYIFGRNDWTTGPLANPLTTMVPSTYKTVYFACILLHEHLQWDIYIRNYVYWCYTLALYSYIRRHCLCFGKPSLILNRVYMYDSKHMDKVNFELTKYQSTSSHQLWATITAQWHLCVSP